MCISQSVGKNAANDKTDVKTIQSLINFNIGKLAPLVTLKVDGCIGAASIDAITLFQKSVQALPNPSGRVDPGSTTLGELKKAVPTELSAALLQAVMPDATAAAVSRYCQGLISGMAANAINTPLRMAHFLAQLGHESGDLCYSEEIASGAAYEGRADLGNTQPGDGPRFKGRGLIQVTGRFNYTAYGKHKGRDFITPTNYNLIATDPELAVDVSCWFWIEHGLNTLADSDNARAITKIINGGLNGFPDRQARLARAKCFLLRPA